MMPNLPYEPRHPSRYNPAIGLIGCGGITQAHLTAYRKAGYRVAALSDVDLSRARKRKEEFYPEAELYADYRELLAREDIEVVDVATHPQDRAGIISAALESRKHVLSQKPFVLDLDTGERLADLADSRGVLLAVNQNGRWAPYFSYMRAAVERGLVGDIYAVRMACLWDHEGAVVGTPFDRLYHVILYDFAIHWFDAVHCFLADRRAASVSAAVQRAPGQRAAPPMLGQAIVQYENAQASLTFDACAKGQNLEEITVVGTKGMLRSQGGVTQSTSVRLSTENGEENARLQGQWFPDGFAGTMGELLCAIEEKRQPSNSARDNLASLALCYAALVSADTGLPQKVGEVRRPSRDRCTIQA